jgi:hypothetical protein
VFEVDYHWNTNGRNQFTFKNDPKKGMALMRAFLYCYEDHKETIDEMKFCAGGSEEDGIIKSLMGIYDEVSTIIHPFDALFGESPNASQFFENLPKVILKIGYDNHPTLLSSYLPFLSLLRSWGDDHPEIISYISYNIHYLNDVLIEHFNSVVQRSKSSNTTLTFDTVADAVATIPVKWDLEEQLGIKKRTISEVMKENFVTYKSHELEEASVVFGERLNIWKGIGEYTSFIRVLTPNKWEGGLQIVKSWMVKREKKVTNYVRGVMTQNIYLTSLKKSSLQEMYTFVKGKFVKKLKENNRERKGEIDEGEEKLREEVVEPKPPKKREDIIEKILKIVSYLGLVEDSVESLQGFMSTLPFSIDFLMIAKSQTHQKRKRDSSTTSDDTIESILPINQKKRR